MVSARFSSGHGRWIRASARPPGVRATSDKVKKEEILNDTHSSWKIYDGGQQARAFLGEIPPKTVNIHHEAPQFFPWLVCPEGARYHSFNISPCLFYLSCSFHTTLQHLFDVYVANLNMQFWRKRMKDEWTPVVLSSAVPVFFFVFFRGICKYVHCMKSLFVSSFSRPSPNSILIKYRIG